MPEPLDLNIRSFTAADLPACRTLYIEGLLGGKLAENDTGVDIDDIESAYMRTDGNHFWVAEVRRENGKGDVVGMIGVQQHEKGLGEIRRLRVRSDVRRRGIGSKLVETALKFCQERSYLKITLDTFLERGAAIKLFETFRFKHERTRSVAGKELLYFYLDIYGREQKQ